MFRKKQEFPTVTLKFGEGVFINNRPDKIYQTLCFHTHL